MDIKVGDRVYVFDDILAGTVTRILNPATTFVVLIDETGQEAYYDEDELVVIS